MMGHGPSWAWLRTRAPPRRGLRWAWVGAWARSCCVMQARAGLIGSLGTAVRPSEVCGPTLPARNPGPLGTHLRPGLVPPAEGLWS